MQKIVFFVLLVTSLYNLSIARENKYNKVHDKSSIKKNINCTLIDYGECVAKDKKNNCGSGKKEATLLPEGCEKYKLKKCKISCKHKAMNGDEQNKKEVCKYEKHRKATILSTCDPESQLQEVSVKLKKGDPSVCPLTKIITKKCKGLRNPRETMNGEKKDKKHKGGKNKKDRKASLAPVTNTALIASVTSQSNAIVLPINAQNGNHAQNKCKYKKAIATECDLSTQTKTLTRSLKKSSDPIKCPATKTQTKPCKPKQKKEKLKKKQNGKKKNQKE